MATLRNRFWRSFIVLFVLLLCLAHPSLVSGQGTTANVHAVDVNEDRSDSFERKMELLQDAWRRGDFDVARSLTHSLRDTVVQTAQEQRSPGTALSPSAESWPIASLPAALRVWAGGWNRFKVVSVQDSAGEARIGEPVEVLLSFPADQLDSSWRELRVAAFRKGTLIEVPSQVLSEVRRGAERYCRLLWLADCDPHGTAHYFVFFGNPDAELPNYPSDLSTEGEGFALDISNAFYKATLSRQTGQLERITLRREHGLELFAGGEGHGEPPGIDWAHDYVDQGGFQKLRISLWDTCPDYEVIRGPLCTIVRRWGFPVSPIYPVFTPARLHIDVEYRFYAGHPWFEKRSTIKAIQDFEAAALRDDEWVFSGQSFTDSLWMDREGRVHLGAVDTTHQEDLWGVGFYHPQSHDSIAALFLEHTAEGLPELKHTGVPLQYYRWHGHVWSRYPLPVKHVPRGATLRQKNAYAMIPFTAQEGPPTLERLRRCLVQPLTIAAEKPDQVLPPETTATATVPTDLAASQRLARPGENNDSPIAKQLIWQALRDSKDAQLYTADIDVVDLGLVYDVRIRGGVVTLVMTMPHRGRPRLGYFINGSISVHPTTSVPIRQRLMQIPGVRQVVFEQTWQPGWSTNALSSKGRRKLGLPALP